MIILTLSFFLLLHVFFTFFCEGWITPTVYRNVILKIDEQPQPNRNKPIYSAVNRPTRAQETVNTSTIIAVRVRHILLQTEEMVKECFEACKTGIDFHELAESISLCDFSREKGGDLGWVGLDDAHLEEVFPLNARQAAFLCKPGDLTIAHTTRGQHLVKVEDVMTRLRTTNKQRPTSGSLVSCAPLLQKVDLKYSITTLGCQMNAADSQRMAGQLEALGYHRTEKAEEANVVVLNTCSIRDHAEQKVYSLVGPLAKRKQSGEPLAIVVAGCVAQQEGERLLRRIPQIDLVMGPQYANRLGDLLEDVSNGNQVVATEATYIMEDITKPRRDSTVCAWVNVIYGCNEHCTYCVVPSTRGVEQSRPRESIKKEIEELASIGYKEITLLGQNIDAYGRDMVPKQKFADLLHYIHDVEGIARIRFVTSHPRYFSDNVIQAVATLHKLMPSFHIPFQSGSNRILREMRRGYTQERFLKLVEKIRHMIPDASITTDAIVGFPGESEDEFQSTLDVMDAVQFDLCNTAAYSPRPGTPAALWENQIEEKVKLERLHRINEKELEHALNRSKRPTNCAAHLHSLCPHILSWSVVTYPSPSVDPLPRFRGRIEKVLVEERNVKRPEQVLGRTTTNKLVYFEGCIEDLRGKIVPVLITDVRAHSMTGLILKEHTLE